MAKWSWTWLVACLACRLAACGDDPSPEHTAEGDDDFKGCPTDGPRFEPGLRARGQHYMLELVAADPSEPERYDNRWTVVVRTLDGEVDSEARILRGQTFMPVHGHDGRIEPTISASQEPGRFVLDDLYFTMRGPWEARLWLTSPSVSEERVVFQVCVAK